MHDLTAFQRDILYVMAGMEEPKGLAIKDELDKCHEQDINPGRLYPNLDKLVEKGLVEKGEIDKRTNYYSLTEWGEDEVDAHVEWMGQYIDLEKRGK